MPYETGSVIIDALKLCYEASAEVLEDLKAINLGMRRKYGDYVFCRETSHHFRYAYGVLMENGDSLGKVMTVGVGIYGDNQERNFAFFRVENHVLYNSLLLKRVLALPEQMGMVFHNFTAIDLAVDIKTDIVRLIRRLWHREDITTIINGKAIKYRTVEIDNLKLIYSASLQRLKGASLLIKQARARQDKSKGLTVQVYNKGKEIEAVSHKYYIQEFYGNPKRLYRLEVHQNNAEIQDYCRKVNRVQDIDMVYDQEFLTAMFYYHLSAVLRFTKGRKKLAWPDIIACNGRL